MKTQTEKLNVAPYALIDPVGAVVSVHDCWIDAYLTDRNAKEYSQDGNTISEWVGVGYRPCQPELS